MKIGWRTISFALLAFAATLGVVIVGNSYPASAQTASPTEARAIAKEAYIYAFPMVEGYKTLYAQAVDKSGPNYKAPFNGIGNTAQAFTPKDTAIVTPNSDTPVFVRLDGSARRADCADASRNRSETLLPCAVDRPLHA